MFKKYFQRKSKLSIAIDIVIGILLILLLIPATRKDVAALIMKPTLIIHQPKVKSNPKAVEPNDFLWRLKDADGNIVQLSEFSNKVILINLWATWCPPCIAEMPDLQSLYNAYGDKMVFLFISNESSKTIKQFLDKKGYNLPVYIPVSDYPDAFQTNSIPTTYILSKQGEIVVEKKGVAKWDSKRIHGILDALINQ